MKLFVRNVNKKVLVVDPLDLSGFDHAEIYKVEVSIDCMNNKSLFNNIRTDQSIIVNANTITIPAGFYNLQELMSRINSKGAVISLITSESNAYHCKLSSQIDFTNAGELKEILGFEGDVCSGISNYCVDITRGMNVLQIYSNIVCSDNDTPVCTIKIDDPTKDFHDTLFTNVSVTCCPINYIDFIIRDIHVDVVDLNADNININFFIRAYEEFDNLTDKTVETSFNITTPIDKLNGGKYTKQLDRSFNLRNGMIVNANFLLDGEINNLSTEQTIELDGVSYTIPAGCYSLQELLARLNALGSGVFSYISSGEDCYKLTITGVEKISCTPELANMLGLEGLTKGDDVETVHYQLTEEANMFVYKNSNASYVIPIATGIYSEKVFFKKLEDAIRAVQNDISIIDVGKYWQLNHGEIHVASGNYVGRCFSKYYYSSGIKYRKEGDANIIPKAGYFYFNEDITFDMINEKVYYFMARSGNKEYELSIHYVDANDKVTETKKYDLRGIPDGVYSAREFYEKIWYNAGISSKYDKSYYYRGHGFFQRKDSGYNGFIRFSGPTEFIKLFHLPTSKTTSSYFEMYLTNSDYKINNPDLTGETLTITYEKFPDQPLTATFSGPTDIVEIFDQVRSLVNNQILLWGYNKVDKHEFLNYNCPMYRLIIPNDVTVKNNLKYKYSGSLVEKGYIRGLHTEYKCEQCRAILCPPSTHRLNLGYTTMKGLQVGLQNLLNSREYGSLLQENMEITVDNNNTIIARNPSAMTTISVNNFNSVAYPDSQRSRQWCDRTELYTPYGNLEVNNDNYQITISKPSGEEQIINLPVGWYTKTALFEKFNSYIEHPFVKKETYWLLDYVPATLDYNLEIDFVVLTNEIRVYYPDKKIVESVMIKGGYPINITNGFNLVNVFTNIVETSANTDNYLTSFVIDNTNGKNISAAGVKHSYANSNKPIDRIIANSNINNIDYYFAREDGQPFNINGKINCTLEIVE